MEEIGYAIDFKEIKRVFCQWIDDYMDHGMILNPKDELLINTIKDYKTKLWLMSLNGAFEYCNPSVENIAKEIFIALEILSNTLYGNLETKLKIHKIKIYETPNCFTECYRTSITDEEFINFAKSNESDIVNYAKTKGVIEYDDRKNK
jgi:6-pyruvoyltetrahydropterin/6-carboxytetrahydropterin synthase